MLTPLETLPYIGYAVAALPISYYAYKMNKYYLNSEIKKNGLLFNWDENVLASAANPPKKMHISGHFWTPYAKLKNESIKNQKKELPLYISNMRFFEDFENECSLPFFIKNKAESLKYYIDAYMTCRSMLVLGSAGGGKTELFHSILHQDWYDKAIIFSKKGDFEPIYFRGTTIDYVVNPKLKYGAVHDILSEKIEFVEVFTESIVKAKLGDKNDFFSSSAKQELEKMIQTVFLEAERKNLNTKERWELLIEQFESNYHSAIAGDSKSKKDVYETVKIIFNAGLLLMAYRIIEGAPTFTAKDFFSKKDSCRIFLNASDPSTEGVVAATYAVLTKYQLALPNKWCDRPVLHLQDEYNSLKEMVPERILVEQREVGRSKMFATLIGVQGLDANKEKSQELLVNMQYLAVFGGTDTATLNTISELVGDVEYEHINKNESNSAQGKSTSYSTQKIKERIVNNYHINILQKEGFSHLFVSLKEGILFKGYTPQVELSETPFFSDEQINLNLFYEWKINREKQHQDKSKNEDDVASILADFDAE